MRTISGRFQLIFCLISGFVLYQILPRNRPLIVDTADRSVFCGTPIETKIAQHVLATFYPKILVISAHPGLIYRWIFKLATKL